MQPTGGCVLPLGEIDPLAARFPDNLFRAGDIGGSARRLEKADPGGDTEDLDLDGALAERDPVAALLQGLEQGVGHPQCPGQQRGGHLEIQGRLRRQRDPPLIVGGLLQGITGFHH
ncbi:hypothetical protein D3C78_1357290 [compost metagenome]